MKPRYHFYFDDSGSRRPDHKPNPPRYDGMDYFALGGVLLAQEDISRVVETHRAFMERWKLGYPLHSTQIRGRRGNFVWLGKDVGMEQAFLTDLENMLCSLPLTALACVIDRVGYNARYAEPYAGQPWLMCKTAFAILIERAAKHVQRLGGELEVFFEQAGRHEDQDIKGYGRLLKQQGMPFDAERSAGYDALSAALFREVVLGEPRERTKKSPMIQIADLLLYPMVKGGYDKTYGPYQTHLKAGQIIDAQLDTDEIPVRGVKYFCFPPR